jgi:signal transduction histidine kinase
MMDNKLLRALMVEDDEDDYVILRDVLYEIKHCNFDLEWVGDRNKAIEIAKKNKHDICFMDYFLGESTGIQLMKSFYQNGFSAPIILLTGMGSYDVDFQAMNMGAADYLEKSRLSPSIVERSIRYAIERSKVLDKLNKSRNQLRALSANLLESQEKERRIVARELHDSVGSSLTAIKFALEEKLAVMQGKVSGQSEISLENIISMVRDTIDETQRISSNLRPSILDGLGIVKTVLSSCRDFQDLYSHIQTETIVNLEESDIPESLKIVIYRIVQEALNNIAKHSGANNVVVSMKKNHDSLVISIQDNGKGIKAGEMLLDGANNSGMGVRGMKERTELSGGEFDIHSKEGKGTVVKAVWPLPFTHL